MDLDCSKDIVLENERVKLSPLSMKHYKPLLPISNANPKLLQFSPSPFGTNDLLNELLVTTLKKT